MAKKAESAAERIDYSLHPEAQDLPEAEMLAAMESGTLK